MYKIIFTVRNIISKHLFFACVLLSVFPLLAQTGSVKGFVYDETTQEPIPFVNIWIPSTSSGAATDMNGYFAISKLPAGEHTLKITVVGYEEKHIPVTISKGRIHSLNVFLKNVTVQLEGIEIIAERQASKIEPKVSVEKITSREVYQLPSIGGQADIAQYMQVLPGVVFTGDQGGQLYIRGGSSIQNLVLLDGMMLFNPFHSIGLFSVFETDIIQSTDVYTGGFGAEYGGRLSSVMNIQTRDGNKKHAAGKVALNSFGATFLLEGPLKKSSDSSELSVSYIFSAKNSYLSQSSKLFYSYIESSLPYDFLDLYGKFTFATGGGSKFNIFGFRFADDVNSYRSLANFHWKNYGVGGNFTLLPESSTAVIGGSMAYSDYSISSNGSASTTEVGKTFSQMSRINGFDASIHASNFFGYDKLKYGINLRGNTIRTSLSQHDTLTDYSTELTAFITYKGIWKKLVFEPGLNLMYYASLGAFSPEPRLAAKLNVTQWLRLKAAGGFYSQAFVDTKSDRDVVNLFTGYLYGTPDLNIVQTFFGQKIDSYLQKAKHLVGGVEIDITSWWSVNVEGYYKWLQHLITINRNRLYDDISDHRFDGSDPQPDHLKKELIIENGVAYGGDISSKYSYDRFSASVIYSLGWVKRENESAIYPPHYDRRHNINVLINYQFGSDYSWEFSARWNYGSGFPFTETNGAYQLLPMQEGGIGTDYVSSGGNLGIYYGELNAGRLPDYHRLDISLKKEFDFAWNTQLELNAGVTNVYSRKNLFFYDRIRGTRINQLPIMPGIGIVWRF